jgi:hypothetical protein
MIWGAIGLNYKSGRIFCSDGIDADEYQGVLQRSGLVNDLDAHHGRFNWFHMQDGASADPAQATARFLSPDLNLIEIVWAIMKRRVKSGRPKTKEELMHVITSIWDELDHNILNRPVSNFIQRLRSVMGVRG